MFAPQSAPRVFALPPGADFSRLFAEGLLERTRGLDPFAMARVRVLVNTNRTGRRLRQILAAEGARLLPRLQPVTALALAPRPGLQAPVSALGRRLQLAQLLLALIERMPELAPRAAAFDLAERLAALLDEMHEEQVAPEALARLDFGALSGHWQRGARILEVALAHFDQPSAAALLAQEVAQLVADWQRAPLAEPLLLVGSTGSRGTTFRLMQAVARLPQGALVLPGFDFGGSDALWQRLVAERAEDHPQYRFARLLDALGLPPSEVRPWVGVRTTDARGRLLSLALRPAPVSDQWIHEGPALGDLAPATDGLTLIEAPSPRAEALAIATLLRHAVHEGQMAAVVTPDRRLTRMIAAELQRWGITPDDSAGEPLALTAQGRLLLQVAELLVAPARIETVLALLKHPLVHAGAGRGLHLERVRQLELALRRKGRPWPEASELRQLAAACGGEAWADWVTGCLTGRQITGPLPLADLVARHLALAERISAGPGSPPDGGGEMADPSGAAPHPGDGANGTLAAQSTRAGRPDEPCADAPVPADATPGGAAAASDGLNGASPRGANALPRLWAGPAGAQAQRVMAGLAREAGAAGRLSVRDYLGLLSDLLGRAEVRSQAEAHTGVRFWGTIEARIQGADLTILAGLNEGSWPARPAPDPWLNRAMRRRLGLTLPERRIGLSAHDFQQAASAPQVVLSRALRDESAETVPARWLNRLTSLLAGLPETGMPALKRMRERGTHWLQRAAQLDLPAERHPPAPRPAPAPPLLHRPRQLSVTEVQTLIRDPYAIYARHVLGLRPLDPLRPEPDAAARGSLIHRAIELFLRATRDDPALADAAAFREAAEAALAEGAPWPGMRELWRGRLEALTPWLVADEARRRARGRPLVIERRAHWPVPGTAVNGEGAEADFTLVGKPDRIDLLADGSAEVVDYKTGSPPTAGTLRHFDRQLLLLALMVEGGAFGTPLRVSGLAHVGLGSQPREAALKLSDWPLDQALDELRTLLAAFDDPAQGYAARRAQEGVRWAGDYDHLARFGEWSASDPAQVQRLGALPHPAPAARVSGHDAATEGVPTAGRAPDAAAQATVRPVAGAAAPSHGRGGAADGAPASRRASTDGAGADTAGAGEEGAGNRAADGTGMDDGGLP